MLSESRALTPLPLCLAWMAGVALQLQQAQLNAATLYAGVGACALTGLIAYFRKTASTKGWCVLLVFLLAWSTTGLRAVYFDAGKLDPALEGRDLRVTGVVASLVQHHPGSLRFRLQTEQATLSGRTVSVPELIDVSWYLGPSPTTQGGWELQQQPADLQPGERWTFTLRPKAPHGSRNPFGFDYELWLWEQGVQATAYVRATTHDLPPVLIEQTGRYPISYARQVVRSRIERHIQDSQASGLVAALVMGDQAAIERTDWDVFRATGVAHLVSISGLHITMFACGAVALVGWCWRRSASACLWWPAPSAALIGGVMLAFFYAYFSGWGIPAQRTCLMLATVAGLRITGAYWPWPSVWALALALVLMVDPWGILQAGFWLSFVAVAVLFSSATPFNRSSDHKGQNHPVNALSAPDDLSLPPEGVRTPSTIRLLLNQVLSTLQSLAKEQWTIGLALAPLSVFLFGQISLIGFVANMVAVPWVTLVITPLSMLGILIPVAWDASAWAIVPFMALLSWLAALPGAVWSMATPPLWLSVLGVLGGIILVLPRGWSLRVLGIPPIVLVGMWQPPLPAIGDFALLAADMGQGNAVLVQTAHHALLFDTGPRFSLESDAGNRVLLPLLQALDVQLDRLVLSHRDSDHTGGARSVLNMHQQADVLSSLEQDHPLQQVRPMQRCVAGQNWVWDGVQFDILHPNATDYAKPGIKPNALSCVLRITSQGKPARTALLTGDIEKPQETTLLLSGALAPNSPATPIDILLVPHHGSKTSSSDAFLDALQPRWAWVQSGYRNRYGHPAPEVLARYAQHSITLLDSPHCGAMRWSSATPEKTTCERTVNARYWQHGASQNPSR